MKTLIKSFAALLCCVLFSHLATSQNIESFSDGDFTSSPAWSGDTGSWIVSADSDVSTGAIGSNTLRLATTGTGFEHLSTLNSPYGSLQTWSFFFGRRGQALTSANSVEIWLYATEADLESVTNTGYRIRIGDNSGGDEFVLEEVTAGVGTAIVSSAAINNGLTDYGVAVWVERDAANLWTLKTSPLPTANGTGMTADQDPIALATITHGTGTNATHTFASSGYFGVVAEHSSGANGIAAVELDQITIDDNGTGLTQFWAEDFGTGCSTNTQASGFVSGNGTWTVTNTGTNETLSNVWYVSAAENGVGAGNCGTGCGGANSRTLHISSNPGLLGDLGAAYYVSGAAGLCGFGICSETNKRAESPVINCTGQTDIELSFDYIENGQGSIDNAELWYYDGTSWSLLADMAKTALCGVQGLWTAFSVSLPSSADDNSGVKIGFRWTNNDDLVGTDPSIAVDDITLSGIVSDPTVVEFTTDNGAAAETDGSIDISVSIADPSFANATLVDVVLISGSAVDLGNYTTQTITFPANSSLDELLTITITDNALCTDDNVYVFELQNVSGGNLAALGVVTTFTLTIDDDEYQYDVLFEDDFEDADISDWTQSTGSLWEAGQTPFGSPITGSYSLAHVDNAFGAGEHYVSNAYSDVCLDGVESTWRFQANYSGEPSQNNYFLVYLTNNGDFGSENGYAIGVFPQIPGAPDHVKLWKMTNGAISDTIINSGVSWTTNGTANPVIDPEAGFEIKRSAAGEWSLKLDIDGGFDNLVSYGTPTVNTDYGFTENFEVLHHFTASLIDALMVDDILFTQEGCSDTYYSQSSGDVSGAIWSTMPVGTAGNAQFGKYTNMVIQSGHVVTFDENVTADDLTIELGATMNGSASFVCLDGDFDNSGALNADTSNISFNANDHGQDINSTSKLTFYELTSSNGHVDGVQLNTDADIINSLYPNEGDFDIPSTVDLVFKSTSSNTGGVAEIKSGASVTGEITLERYIDAGNQAHIAICSSIENLTVADFDEDIITTGFPGSDWPAYSLNNWFKYDTPTASFVYATSDADPIDNTVGYFYLSVMAEQFIDLKGTFNNGDESVVLSDFGSALNVIANPYPCSIDWDLIYAESVNLDPTILIYDSDNYTFLTYNAMTQSGTYGNVIESSQGFFVKPLSGGGTVEFKEAHKVIDGVDIFERVSTLQNEISIILSNESYEDEVYVAFAENATSGYDPIYDSEKVSPFIFGEEPYAPHFVSTVSSDDKKLIENVQSSSMNELNIPIHITVFEEGEFDLTLNTPEELQGVCLVLTDVLSGESYSVSDETVISFYSEVSDEVRFYLNYSNEIAAEVEQISCFGMDDASIAINSDVERSYEWYNEVDELILSESTSNGSTISNLAFGNYTVVIEDENTLCGQVSRNFYIHQVQDETFQLETEIAYCNSVGGGEISMLTYESFDYSLFDDNQNLLETGEIIDYKLWELEASIYTIELSNSCGTETLEMDLRDPNRVQVEVLEVGTINLNGEESVEVIIQSITQNADELTWYLDGELLSSDEDVIVEIYQEGDYEVTLKGIQDNCEDEDHLTLEVENVISVDQISDNIFSYSVLDNMVNITWKDASLDNYRLSLVDLSGRIISDEQINAGATSVNMDISGFSSGIYLLNIQDSENNLFAIKLIKN